MPNNTFRINRRQLIYTTVFGLSFSIFILSLFVYYPLIREHQRLTEQYMTIKNELIKGQQLLTHTHINEGLLLKRQDSTALINEISKTGEFYSINFLSIDPKDIEGTTDFKRYQLQLNIQAQYQNFGRFLSSLEQIENTVIVVDSFSIGKNKEEGSPLKIKLNLNLYSEDDHNG